MGATDGVWNSWLKNARESTTAAVPILSLFVLMPPSPNGQTVSTLFLLVANVIRSLKSEKK